jgi:hypothetical protein
MRKTDTTENCSNTSDGRIRARAKAKKSLNEKKPSLYRLVSQTTKIERWRKNSFGRSDRNSVTITEAIARQLQTQLLEEI